MSYLPGICIRKVLIFGILVLIAGFGTSQNIDNIKLARVIGLHARFLDGRDTVLYKATIVINQPEPGGYWIREYGTVKIKDTINLITGKTTVDIYRSDKRTLISSLKLADPIYLQGIGSYEIPHENDFPGFGRSGKLKPAPDIDAKVRAVFDKYSREGYNRSESSGTINIITPYLDLPLSASSKYLGFVSFFLKYNNIQLNYEIKLSAMESMKLDSEKRVANSAEVKNAATNLLQKIINDLIK